jgi:hypothetical protein
MRLDIESHRLKSREQETQEFLKIALDFVENTTYNSHMNRIQAIAHMVNALRRIDGRTSPWDASYTFATDVHGNVIARDRYIEEIDSFPVVMLVPLQEIISHTGGGQRWSTLTVRIRAICWDEVTELAGERLADDIEHVVSHMRRDHPRLEELRIDTIQTDEGLNAPLGAVVVQLTAVYQHD